jgi:predicted phage terminase large subunit-like protein
MTASDYEVNELIDDCTHSLLAFTRLFYRLRTGRDFLLSKPIGRESHHLTICRALMKVFKGETQNLIINVPPRYGKSELVIHFIAWALGNLPDSNFLYTSYALALARKQTQTIRSIITLPEYRSIFNVEMSQTVAAKADFETKNGGSVYAAGSGGTITGRGAGIQYCERFGGAIIIDDIYKPDEVTSDVIREGTIDWYYNTLQSRVNSPTTPIIYIGQRLHEHELVTDFLGEREWDEVIIPALDEANNPLNPAQHDLAALLKIKEKSPYEFAAQYQQNPVPAGGGIYKRSWFYLTDDEPEILSTFITADTAETDKDWNDASVFSFWGVYKVKNEESITGQYALHWLACREIRVEPAYLEGEFRSFYSECSRYKIPPQLVAIEKKSTGATLVSILDKLRGIKVQGIERTKASGSKTARFLEMQSLISQKLISLPRNGKHTEMCITHMCKITANDSHAHDDICDTVYDAVKIGLIDKYLINTLDSASNSKSEAASQIMGAMNRRNDLRRTRNVKTHS